MTEKNNATQTNALVIGVFVIALMFAIGVGITGNSIFDFFFEENVEEETEAEESEGNWFMNLFGFGNSFESSNKKNDPPKPGEKWNGLDECSDNGPMPPKPGTGKPAPTPPRDEPKDEPPKDEPPVRDEPKDEPPKDDPKPPKKPEEKCEECLGGEFESIIPRNPDTGEKIYNKVCVPPKYSKKTCEPVKPAGKVTRTECVPRNTKHSFPGGHATFPVDYKDSFSCTVDTHPVPHDAGRCFGFMDDCGPVDGEWMRTCTPEDEPCWKYGAYKGDVLQIEVTGCLGEATPTDPKLLPTCEWKGGNKTSDGEPGWTTNMSGCTVVGEGEDAYCEGGCHVQYLYPEDDCKPKPENKISGICDLKCQEMKKRGLE